LDHLTRYARFQPKEIVTEALDGNHDEICARSTGLTYQVDSIAITAQLGSFDRAFEYTDAVQLVGLTWHSLGNPLRQNFVTASRR
jgi:hypothetical protein